MTLLIIGLLVLISAGCALMMFVTRMRLLNARSESSALPNPDRYRPMLRLLSDDDLDFAAASPLLRGRIRAQRREMLRGYLRCLTKDYARLLAGLRRIMVESEIDRPDLAGALAKNRFRFAMALCRIELHLQLHALGIGKVDVSGLVEALDGLRGAVNGLTPVAGAAY